MCNLFLDVPHLASETQDPNTEYFAILFSGFCVNMFLSCVKSSCPQTSWNGYMEFYSIEE